MNGGTGINARTDSSVEHMSLENDAAATLTSFRRAVCFPNERRGLPAGEGRKVGSEAQAPPHRAPPAQLARRQSRQPRIAEAESVQLFAERARAHPGMPRVCRSCGAAHPNFARFCRRCGHKL